MDTRTAEQKEVIQNDARKLRIVAGPGTGKTATLIDRVFADFESSIEEHKAVVLTYTVSAATEIAERLGRRTCYVGTLHGWLWSKIAHQGLRLLSEDEAYNAWIEAAHYCAVHWGPKEAAYAKRQPTTREAKLVAEHYRKMCVAQNAICLDSLIWGIEWQLAASALYLDEAQDCSATDWQLITSVDTKRLVVIGDPNQAIFSFRGNSAAWLHDKTFSEHRLTVCHRCTGEIVDAANLVIPTGLVSARKPWTDSACPSGEVHIETLANTAAELDRISHIVEAREGATVGIMCRYNKGAAAIREALGIAIPTIDRPKLLSLIAVYADPSSVTARAIYMRNRHAKPQLGNDGLPILDFDPTCKIAQICVDAKLSRDETALMISLAGGSYDPSEWAAAIARETEANDDITVTTIHGAKGKEFDLAIVAGADLIPDKRSPLDDERRLLYVAITRARDTLYITSAAERNGQPRPACPLLGPIIAAIDRKKDDASESRK